MPVRMLIWESMGARAKNSASVCGFMVRAGKLFDVPPAKISRRVSTVR